MSIATVFEIVLAIVVMGLGTWTIIVRETYSATVGFVAYGLLVALIWVRLDAVDVGPRLLGILVRRRDNPVLEDHNQDHQRNCHHHGCRHD